MVKKTYEAKNIPSPFPAANKHLQDRLQKFVSKGKTYLSYYCPSISFLLGITDNQTVCYFDKVNSNRVYSLEKQSDINQLMVEVKEKDEEPSL
jgi:hypothetical protein